jgi:hypothetical protein
MAIRVDLPVKANGDLDLGIKAMAGVFSDNQHQRDMFSSQPGDWKQFPHNGIGVAKYLKSPSNKLLTLKNQARQQLQNDGYSVGNLQIAFDENNKMLIQTNASR